MGKENRGKRSKSDWNENFETRPLRPTMPRANHSATAAPFQTHHRYALFQAVPIV